MDASRKPAGNRFGSARGMCAKLVGCARPLLALLLGAFACQTARADATADTWKAGDDVVIAAGDTVVVESPTPELKSLVVNGTLVCSNWTTRVAAKSITVAAGGVVTCAGPFWDREVTRRSDSAVFPAAMSNRVWLAANESLTVAAGGTVTVDAKGYG